MSGKVEEKDMAAILHVDASPRGAKSQSRLLAGEFIGAWKESHPGDKVVTRDLAKDVPPAPTAEWIEAAFEFKDPGSPRTKTLLADSDRMIAELRDADRIVLSSPMHNFSVPATLKAYFDRVVRPRVTFRFGADGPEGLLPKGKKLLVVTARGGIYAPGTPSASLDHQEPFIRAVFGFMGVADATFVNAEGLNMGDEPARKGMAEARRKLAELARGW